VIVSLRHKRRWSRLKRSPYRNDECVYILYKQSVPLRPLRRLRLSLFLSFSRKVFSTLFPLPPLSAEASITPPFAMCSHLSELRRGGSAVQEAVGSFTFSHYSVPVRSRHWSVVDRGMCVAPHSTKSPKRPNTTHKVPCHVRPPHVVAAVDYAGPTEVHDWEYADKVAAVPLGFRHKAIVPAMRMSSASTRRVGSGRNRATTPTTAGRKPEYPEAPSSEQYTVHRPVQRHPSAGKARLLHVQSGDGLCTASSQLSFIPGVMIGGFDAHVPCTYHELCQRYLAK
jgi:hypothetical protein